MALFFGEFSCKLHAFGALAALAYLQDPLQEDGQEVGVVGAMQCDEIKAFGESSQDEVARIIPIYKPKGTTLLMGLTNRGY